MRGLPLWILVFMLFVQAEQRYSGKMPGRQKRRLKNAPACPHSNRSGYPESAPTLRTLEGPPGLGEPMPALPKSARAPDESTLAKTAIKPKDHMETSSLI